MGRKTTIMTRKMPRPSNRTGGPTLLTAGNSGLRANCRAPSMFGSRVSIKTIITEPIIGPSIVPRPPITDIINGWNELSAAKTETLMYLRKWVYIAPANPAKNVLKTNA